MPCDGRKAELGNPERFQRLKASVDVAVCTLLRQVGESQQLDIERETQAVVAQLVFDKILRSAQDLEAFAGHAKRSTVTTEDVRLLTRNTPHLREHLASCVIEVARSHPPKKTANKTKKRKNEETAQIN